jgi:hypothetical protein
MSRSLTVGWERHFSVLAKTLHFDRVLKINDCIADLDIDIMDAFGWSGTADAFPATCQRVVNSSIFYDSFFSGQLGTCRLTASARFMRKRVGRLLKANELPWS